MIASNAREFTLAQLNAYLKTHGAKSRLVKGAGYYYFVDGGAHLWYSDSVMVYRCTDMTPDQWLEEYRSKSAEALGSADDGDRFFSAEALSRARSESAPEASRWTLCHMSPSEFLRMAKSPPPGGSKDKLEGVEECLSKGKKFDDVPYLKFVNGGDGTALVVGHEGRHRSMALRSRGVRRMPVLLCCLEGGAGVTIRWGQVCPEDAALMPVVLKGQEDHVGYSIPFPESDVHPLPKTESASSRMRALASMDAPTADDLCDLLDALCDVTQAIGGSTPDQMPKRLSTLRAYFGVAGMMLAGAPAAAVKYTHAVIHDLGDPVGDERIDALIAAYVAAHGVPGE